MFFEDSSIDTEQKIPLGSTNLSVLNQSEVLEKFGQTTETLQMLNAVSNKAKGTNLNFEIETERIYSITGTNFHSLTYLVSYPNHPDLVVNLVLFSTDFRNYHPLIYKYDIPVSSVTKETKIKKEHLLPVRIRKGQHYLDALTEVPKGTNIDINDPCVRVYEKPVANKCVEDNHLPGDPSCIYIGGEGAAFYSYELVIDVSDCGNSGGGVGTGPAHPGNGYVGIEDPGNPVNSNPVYDSPWLGGPGGGSGNDNGGWIPVDPIIIHPNLPLPGFKLVGHFRNELNTQQLNWWNSNAETPERAGLYDYIYNGGDFSFAQWAIDFFIENDDVSWEFFENWFVEGGDLSTNLMSEFLSDLDNPNLIIHTKRFKNNSRLNAIYNRVKNHANIKQYLQNFEPEFSVAHLVLDVQPFENNSESNARTYEPEHYRIEIVFNENKLNRPWLDIARTMLHEVIHAEMFRVLLSLSSTNGQINKIDLINKLTSHNYPGLYEYYRVHGFQNMQHEQMASNYRGIIRNFLMQLDSTLTYSQADAMAWVGLQGTGAWNNLTTQQQNTIFNTYNSWKNSAPINLP